VITPEEALLIFKKWKDEDTPLFCTSSLFSCWGMAFKGRVVSIERDDEIRIDSVDGVASLFLTLSGAEDFEYAEPGHAPEPIRSLVPPEARQTSFLLVALPLRVWEPLLKRDKLAFVELPR
jgi:hypothetical protein